MNAATTRVFLRAHVRPRASFSGIAVTAGAVAAAALLAGCGTGQLSQTAEQVAAINGNAANVGPLELRNVHIVTPANAAQLKAGGSADLAFVVANSSANDDDTLLSVTSDVGTVAVTGDLTIPKLKALNVVGNGVGTMPSTGGQDSDSAASDGKPTFTTTRVEFVTLTHDIKPGLTVPVTFKFQRAGSVTVSVPLDAGPDIQRDDAAIINESTDTLGQLAGEH